jgi:BirA family transcriptional regulator, biotin operon repressor / biotin---[acetyl-CoA-carboxylase] ligase
VSDRLSATGLRAELGDGVLIGREIIVHEQTTSTNDCLWQLALDGATEGFVVFAEHQSAGRGQRGNTWESAAGKGLWFSLLLHPLLPVEESPRITEWAAKTIAGTIKENCSLRAVIKRPNDVYIRGRKVAGVLVEMRARPRASHAAIVGIGINVNQQPHDFSDAVRDRAISLAMLCGNAIDRSQLAAALLRKLNATYCSGAL